MSDYMRNRYFEEPMLSRQRLLWALATRRQLERWELYVARDIASVFQDRPSLEDADLWASQSEHHLLVIAARNRIGALDLPPKSAIEIDVDLRDDIVQGRGALEHWKENMPAFNVRAHRGGAEPKHRSSRAFAERNPREAPFEWLDWTASTGPRVMPHAPASDLHALVDAVEAEALSVRPELARFIPPRAPSPWRRDDDGWWPAIDG
jgi:hypothetical protein